MEEIDFKLLISLASLIAVETIGLVQWMKNLVNKSSKSKSRIYTAMTLITVIGCTFINTSIVPKMISIIINLFLSSLAITQLAWDVIVKGVPRAINGFIDRFTDNLGKIEIKDQEINKTEENEDLGK